MRYPHALTFRLGILISYKYFPVEGIAMGGIRQSLSAKMVSCLPGGLVLASSLVFPAVRMVPAKDQLYMAMADGSEVQVEHVNPTAGRLLYLNSMPTIFLRMADSTNLLLPIVVGMSVCWYQVGL